MIKRKSVVIGCIVILYLIQMSAFAEDNSEIRFIVNNQEVVCKTEPLFTDSQEPLVTLDDLAQMIDITVLWDGKGTSFAIGYGDYALLFYLKENKIFSAHNYKYDEWDRVESSMKAEVFYSQEKKQFFVPISKIASFFSIDSMYERDTENGGTLYLTYDNIQNNMTAEKLVCMDMVAYINQNGAERFNEASEDFQEFAENRNELFDALGIGFSHLMDGPKQWLSGLKNGESGVKEALKIILTSIPENDVVVVDTKTANTVRDALDNTKKVLDIIFDLEKKGLKESEEINEVKNYFEELRKELEKIPQETILETYETLSKKYDMTSKIYEIAEFSLKPIAIFLSDYKKNIQYLELLYEALEESGELDKTVQVSIDALRIEYSNKALNVLGELRDAGTEYVITEAANLATGGIFGIGLFTWKSIFGITGVNGKGEALKTFHGTFIINGSLDRAYMAQCEKVIQGDIEEDEIEKLRLLDNLQKAVKTTMYKCMEQITNDKETREYCKVKQEYFSKNCLSWTEQMVFEKDDQEDNAVILPNTEIDNIDLFSELPESFLHSGGVGGWGETLNINEDGSFSGIYHDSDSGASPKEWICRYNGKLGSPQKIEDGVYSAKVEELNLEEEPGKSYMENGVKYTYVTPAGMKNADAVNIYVPGCLIGKIPEEASNWVYLYGLAEETEVPTGTYLIYNKNEERMFIGEIQKDALLDENKLNSETETSNIEWLNVNQEYEQYDFDGDGLNDSIAMNLGEQMSGEAVIYINGQEAYVLRGTEGTYASYCIITLANGTKFIYAELADSAYYSEEQIILKIKGNTLEKVVDFEQLIPEYEVRHYLGRRGVDKYDSISVKGNVITMEYCTNNFTVGVATISIDFWCQDNGNLESDYTGNVKKIVFSTTGERYLDETYEYEVARDIETYAECQNPQTPGCFISTGEKVTIRQYCIADGIIWFQIQSETGETGWVKGIISNAPYGAEAALFSNAYGAG